MEKESIDQGTELESEKTRGKTRASRKSALDFRKYTKQIWLAGLGLFHVQKKKGINYLTH
jgi:hypothetical protein